MTTKLLRSSLQFTKVLLNSSSPSANVTDKSRQLWTTCHLMQTLNKQNTQSTVDADDVARHTKLLEDWWNPTGPMKALHAFNHIRVPFVRDGLVQPTDEKTSKPLVGKKILDVGCGGGILSEALARLGAEVTGVDASKELIGLAQTHSSKDPRLVKNRPTYYCTPIEDHAPKYENYYDGVVASEIIEHIDNENKELFIKSCIHTLKPDGRIFITTPCRTNIAKIAVIYLAEYVLGAVPKGTHQYKKLTTPSEITFLLERNGCHVEMILGSVYNFLTNKWQWCSNQSLMFAVQAVKHPVEICYK